MPRATREYDPSVTPDMICGGVWVEDEGRFVSVSPAEEFRTSDNTSLWDYREDGVDGKGTGPVRACLLETRDSGKSPSWLLTEEAAQEGYYERHVAVDGAGSLEIASEWNGARTMLLACTFWNWPMKPFELTAGQSFHVQARGVGARVLATFPGVPFQSSYETRLDN